MSDNFECLEYETDEQWANESDPHLFEIAVF